MQHVSQKWLRLLQIGLLSADLSLVLIYLYMRFGNVSAATQALWGNNVLVVIVCAIHALYSLAVYPRLKKQYPWIAGAISLALFGIILAAVIEITGNVNYFYQALYLILAFFFGMLGPMIPIAAGVLVFTLFFFTLLGVNTSTALQPGLFISLGMNIVSVIVSFLGWRVFQPYYTEGDAQESDQLAGLAKTRQQLTEIIIQSIGDGMIVINTQGKISMLNPAAAAMTEWPIDEAVGIDVQLVVKLGQESGEEIPASANPFVQILTEKKPFDGTMQLSGRSGKHLTVSLVLSPVLAPKTQEFVGAVAVIRDISLTRAEEQRRADFISTASHEMRTPVAAIEGYLALALNEKVSKIDGQARNFLEKAHASTQNLGKLFQDLLTSAKAEDGRLVSHPEVLDMGNFIEQLTDSLRFSAEKKGLMMEFIIGSGEQGSVAGGKVVKPLYYVHADPERLREVLINLFDNAVKYTENGKISLGLTGNKDVVQLYVRDTGPGIPAEDVPHLFQKFYRVDSSITRTVGGTGLGLFICRKIIELYKGRLWVESTVGQGSTFYINLPRLDPAKAAALQAASASQSSPLSTTSSTTGPQSGQS